MDKYRISTFLKNLVQIMFAPSRGWEDLENEDMKSDAYSDCRYFRCFLLWIGFCGMSAFVKLIYGSAQLLEVAQDSLITFVSLFLAAQCAKYIFSVYMPNIASADQLYKSRWTKIIIYALSYLGLIDFVANLVKVRIALIEFLPLFVVFIVWKGWRYAGVEERNVGFFVIMATVSILGSTYLIETLLEMGVRF